MSAAGVLAVGARRLVKPGPWRAWRIERAKCRTRWFLVAVGVVGLMAQGLGAWNYLRYREYFTTPELGWFALWVQGSILVTTLFLPVVYVVTLAAVASSEFDNRGWLRVMSTDRLGTAITGKLLYALELAVIGMGVYLLETIATGLALGLGTRGLGAVVVRAGVAALGAWSIGAAMMLVGVLLTDFTSMTLVGVGGAIVGLMVTVGSLNLDRVIPFCLITVGMGARVQRTLLDPAEIAATCAVCLLWVVVSTLGARWRLRQRQW